MDGHASCNNERIRSHRLRLSEFRSLTIKVDDALANFTVIVFGADSDEASSPDALATAKRARSLA